MDSVFAVRQPLSAPTWEKPRVILPSSVAPPVLLARRRRRGHRPRAGPRPGRLVVFLSTVPLLVTGGCGHRGCTSGRVARPSSVSCVRCSLRPAAISAGRRRSGSGRRARRHRLAAIGTGSPRTRARCTVRATSSHMTAALTAARASRADGEDAVVAHQHRRRAVPGQRRDDALADVVAADERERSDRDLPAELVRLRGQHTRDRLPASRPRRGVRAVGVHDAAHLAASPGRRRRARRCHWTATGRPRPGCRRGRRRPCASAVRSS